MIKKFVSLADTRTALILGDCGRVVVRGDSQTMVTEDCYKMGSSGLYEPTEKFVNTLGGLPSCVSECLENFVDNDGRLNGDVFCKSPSMAMLILTGKKGNFEAFLKHYYKEETATLGDQDEFNAVVDDDFSTEGKTAPAHSMLDGSTTTAPIAQTAPTIQKSETLKSPVSVSFAQKQKLVEDIRTYCKDFDFKPDNRALDTMKRVSDPTLYLCSFMKVTGYDDELLERASNDFKAPEWKAILTRLEAIKTEKDPINKRLSIYFGSAGTGKTTRAVTLYPNAVKIAGSATKDPDDLFTAFNPVSSKYELTEIGQAMQDGKPIILDEANLLNSAVLARLQSVLDNTDKVTDRGQDIAIKDGFKVIMTMNLETNLGKTPLPNPLVSRAIELIDFDLDPAFKDKTANFIW